jgi:hypothetical protein
LKGGARGSLEVLYDGLRRFCLEAAVGEGFGAQHTISRAARGDLAALDRCAWCVKTFPTAESFAGLRRLFPRLRAVYVMRNGADVVHSRTRFASFRDGSFEDHCRVWADSVQRYTYAQTAPEVFVVRHEHLVADPAALYAALLAFLGLRDHPGPAEYAASTLVHPLDQDTQRGLDARAALLAREPGHVSWSGEQRSVFRAICGEAMQRAGYAMPF